LPTGCKKKIKKRDGENENITEKSDGSLLRQSKTFYRILGRAGSLIFKFLTGAIEKLMKIFQE